jgi:uncharacterized protein YciW
MDQVMDAVDKASGLEISSPLHALRRQRPEFVNGAEGCRRAVLEPRDDLGLSPALRAALAKRIASQNADAVLIAHYEARLAAEAPDAALKALAEGKTDLPQPFKAMARHSDLVTSEPSTASASDIERLSSAGLTTPQIVALSELIAFVNFEARVVAGLRLLKGA